MTGSRPCAIYLWSQERRSIVGRSPDNRSPSIRTEVSARNKENVMPQILLPLGIRVSLEYEVFGKVVVNIYHVTTTDPIISLKLLDITEIFEAWWTDDLSTVMSPDIALTQITALNLNEANGEKFTLGVAPAVPGQEVGGAVSNNVAIVASLATAKTGRSFRGRSYQAGLPETYVTANNMTTSAAALIVGYYANLVTDLAVENTTLVVASFQALGVPRETGLATPVDSVSVNTRIDTQRRRLPVA